MNKLIRWLDYRFPLLTTWRAYASRYYVPKNLNAFYYLGSLAVIVFFNQLITGLWLTMFYTPTAKEAFDSIQYIMRDVHYGWLIRTMHSTGASAFFILIYLHMYKALLYGSYQKPRELLWLIGMGLYVLLMAEAFFGYLLPWGQMSYWGAEVLTSLFGSVPFLGKTVTTWLRGDLNVADCTLHRFFALHVIGVPILFLFFVFLHIIALHKVGSNNPEGIDIKKVLGPDKKPLDGIPLHPYYSVKDCIAIIVFLILFFAVVFFAPEMGGYFLELNNNVPANPLVTPKFIAPAWYFSPFYAMLRVVPSKSLGLILMGLSIVMLCLIPWLDKSPVKSIRYKGGYSIHALFAFSMSFFLLGYLGTLTLTPIRQYLAQAFTVIYFAYFLFMPLYTRYETCKPVPERIGL